MTYDALVVGAGPAGSHLAYLLARTGRRVALIDKQRFPREKVCGGGLTRKAVALLDFDIAPLVHRWIRGAYLTFQNRSSVVKDIAPAAGCTVVREEFDEALAARAGDAGAEFLPETSLLDLCTDGERAMATTNRGVYCARRLYAADGVVSTVRAKVFGRHAVAYVPVVEALITIADDTMERYGDRIVFDFGGMPKGYGWIFPKRDHLNVGVYSPFGATHLRRHLDRFTDRYPALGRRGHIEYRGFAIPIRTAAAGFERGPVTLLGDAAGLAEPLFGEGIYFALKSAALAAQAEIEDERGASASRYTELLRRELLPELGAAMWLARLLFAFQAFAYRRLVCNDHINDLFAGLITGEVGYRECLRRTALASPRWLWRPAAACEGAIV